MGEALKSVSRSSNQTSGIVQQVAKTYKIGDKKSKLNDKDRYPKKKHKNTDRHSNKKKPVVKDVVTFDDDDVMDEFEKNILEQTTQISEEADKLYKATLKSEVKREQAKKIPVSQIIKDKQVAQVVKQNTTKSDDVDLDSVIDDIDVVLGKSEKLVSKNFEDHPVPSKKKPVTFESTDEFGKTDTVVISSGSYDYGKAESRHLSFSSAPYKEILFKPLKDDPDVLQADTTGLTKVFYVKKNHPLYNKILDSFGSTVHIVPIHKGLTNDLIFGHVFDSNVYSSKKDCYFDRLFYKVVTKDYKAELVLGNYILYYKNAAYYTFFEKHDNKIENIILIEVDVIFSL